MNVCILLTVIGSKLCACCSVLPDFTCQIELSTLRHVVVLIMSTAVNYSVIA